MLSIIIPTLNEEKYLPFLLEEIKKQSFSDYEIIVADAGSRDRTVEIARSFGAKVVAGGVPAKGRNEGVMAARGEILLFMDADNICLPENFLEDLIGEFQKRNLGVATFPLYPKGNLFDKLAYGLYNWWVRISQSFIPHASNSILVKKEIHQKVGGFAEDIKIAEDHDFARRAAKVGKFGFIKTKPVLTSCRRFEKDGRIKTYLTYLLAGIWILFFGPIKSDIFNYRFDSFDNVQKCRPKINNMEEKLPQVNWPKLKYAPLYKKKTFWIIIFIIFLSLSFGFGLGMVSGNYLYPDLKDYLAKWNIKILGHQVLEKEKVTEEQPTYPPQTSQEEAVIKVVNESFPAVVSIIVSKNLPIYEQYFYSPFEEFPSFQVPQYRQKGTEKQDIGGGTGFIISQDGMIITNAHVVSDKDAEYTVFANDGQKYSAKVLARDSLRDLAVIKIEKEGKFPVLKLGNSDKLQIGQTVITIGNALGEFRNTISVGVISGLGRTVTASGGGAIETLEDVIQTDAAINPGNSGGPLLNLKGEVIGVNFAMVQQAENIGFALPINRAERDIEQVKSSGKISYPFLGVRYVLINEQTKTENNLTVDYGAWLIKGGNGEPAVAPGSVAEKAGLEEKDIILEFNGEKITTENSLAKLIMKQKPGDKVTLKVLRQSVEKNFEVILSEMNE